jgi:biotin transport system substrate-specific component
MSSIALKKTNIKEITLVLMGVFLLFAFSQVTIPIEPVPVVLATVGIMLIGITYNMRSGMTTIIAYVTIGIMGIPVFSGYSGGIHVLSGPTGGYIFGYILAVYVMNKLKCVFSKDTSLGILLNCLCGTIAIFALGIPWLAMLIGFKASIEYGLLPFILPGIIKATMLTAVLRSLGYIKKSNIIN